MKIKPSSANTKKPLPTDKPQSSKKPTVVKCFICNQMFYQQQTFDSHMDQHQKKVNKNFPDQIQRKTMESFGLKKNSSMNKKNSTLQAISQNEIKDKNLLNKTLKFPLTPIQPTQNPFVTKLAQTKSAIMKKPVKKLEQSNKSKDFMRETSESPSKKQLPAQKQIQEIDEALKQSSLLISQMLFITEKYDHEEQIIKGEQVQSENQSESQEEQVEKNVSQHEFIQSFKKNNWPLNVIEQEILKVKFSHKSLENCQIQIEFLRKLTRLSSDSSALEKINKTKSKIVAEIVKIIMSEQGPVYIQQSKNKMQSHETREEENHEARTCSECLDMIGFAQVCIIQGDNFFHRQCFLERKEFTY